MWTFFLSFFRQQFADRRNEVTVSKGLQWECVKRWDALLAG